MPPPDFSKLMRPAAMCRDSCVNVVSILVVYLLGTSGHLLPHLEHSPYHRERTDKHADVDSQIMAARDQQPLGAVQVQHRLKEPLMTGSIVSWCSVTRMSLASPGWPPEWDGRHEPAHPQTERVSALCTCCVQAFFLSLLPAEHSVTTVCTASPRPGSLPSCRRRAVGKQSGSLPDWGQALCHCTE